MSGTHIDAPAFAPAGEMPGDSHIILHSEQLHSKRWCFAQTGLWPGSWGPYRTIQKVPEVQPLKVVLGVLCTRWQSATSAHLFPLNKFAFGWENKKQSE